MGHEPELVTRALGGDQTAVAELIRRHQRDVHRLAYRILGNADDADDVTQETFVRAFRYLGSFDVSRSFGNWLFGIVIRLSATCARKRAARDEVALDEASEMVAPMVSDDTAIRDALRRALRRLPVKQRAAFVLYAHEGHSLEGVAEVLGCSVGSVKTHLHRARKKLRRELAGFVRGGGSDELCADARSAGRARSRQPAPGSSRPCLELQ